MGSSFPSGTKMVFHQSSPPTGWVFETNDTSVLRVVSAANFSTGSGGTRDYNTVLADTSSILSLTPTLGQAGVSASSITTSQVTVSVSTQQTSGSLSGSTNQRQPGGSVQNKTPSQSELTRHRHTIVQNISSNGSNNWGQGSGSQQHRQANGETQETGQGNGHNHGLSVDNHNHDLGGNFSQHTHGVSVGQHDHTFSFDAGQHTHDINVTGSAPLNLDVKYVNVVVGTKS